MKTATASDGQPNNLPIWARLNLSQQGIAFGDVDFWESESETCICVYLKPYGYALLHKR